MEQTAENTTEPDLGENTEQSTDAPSGTLPSAEVIPPPRKWNTQNLRPPWQRGQTGNAKGRPKKGPLSQALDRHLGKKVPEEIYAKLSPGAQALIGKRPTVAQLVAWMHIQSCLTGDAANIRELYNRVEGRNPHKVNLQTTDKLDELRRALEAGPVEPGQTNPVPEDDGDEEEDDD